MTFNFYSDNFVASDAFRLISTQSYASTITIKVRQVQNERKLHVTSTNGENNLVPVSVHGCSIRTLRLRFSLINSV